MSRYLQVLLIAVILGGLVASAQVSTGTISGIVQDQSGASIAGAMVTIRNVDTGAARTLTTTTTTANDFDCVGEDPTLGNGKGRAGGKENDARRLNWGAEIDDPVEFYSAVDEDITAAARVGEDDEALGAGGT